PPRTSSKCQPSPDNPPHCRPTGPASPADERLKRSNPGCPEKTWIAFSRLLATTLRRGDGLLLPGGCGCNLVAADLREFLFHLIGENILRRTLPAHVDFQRHRP